MKIFSAKKSPMTSTTTGVSESEKQKEETTTKEKKNVLQSLISQKIK